MQENNIQAGMVLWLWDKTEYDVIQKGTRLYAKEIYTDVCYPLCGVFPLIRHVRYHNVIIAKRKQRIDTLTFQL